MVIPRMCLITAVVLLVATAGACDPCPEVSMLEGEDGLIIVEEDHPDGWGRADCHRCHAMEALHRRGCSEGVDLALVRAAVDEGGLDACASCHGGNETTDVEEEG